MGIIAGLLTAWKFTRIPRLSAGGAKLFGRIPPAGWGLIGAFALGFAASTLWNNRVAGKGAARQIVALVDRLEKQGEDYQTALDTAVGEITRRANVNAALTKKFDTRIRQIEEGSKRDVKDAIENLPACIVGADYIRLLNDAASGWTGPGPDSDPPRQPAPGKPLSKMPD